MVNKVVDRAVINQLYVNKLLSEIRRKSSLDPSAGRKGFVERKGFNGWILAPRGEKPSILECSSCDREISLGSEIHIQRTRMKVRVFHQACWDRNFLI